MSPRHELTCRIGGEGEVPLPADLPPPESAGPKRLALSLAVRAGWLMRSLFGPRLRDAFGILMYHRVADVTPGVCPPTMNVTPARFRAQLEGLLALGYQPLPLREVLARARDGQVIPRNAFVVTFDDGFENVHRHAWPVLRDLGVPATVFVTTAYLDSDTAFPFDDWPAAGSDAVPPVSWRPLTTAQCREMLGSGLVELGTHTHTHADFRGRPADLREDLLRSCEALHTRFGLKDATFAFPFGSKRLGLAGGELAAAAVEAGVLCALTTENELVTRPGNPFDWGRITVEEVDTAAAVAVKLDGWYGLAKDAWRSLRCSLRGGAGDAPRPASRPAEAPWLAGVGATQMLDYVYYIL